MSHTGHVTYNRVTSRIKQSRTFKIGYAHQNMGVLPLILHITESCHTFKWVMSHIPLSHVTHMNESCHTLGWVISHTWINSNPAHFKPGMLVNTGVVYRSHHICMSHVTHIYESCHTYLWVMSHKWMSHVAHIMSHVAIFLSHVAHMNKQQSRTLETGYAHQHRGGLPPILHVN